MSDLHHLSFSFWDAFSYQLKALTCAFRRIKSYELPLFHSFHETFFPLPPLRLLKWLESPRRSSSRTSIMAIQKFIIPGPETEHWLYRIDLKQFGL